MWCCLDAFDCLCPFLHHTYMNVTHLLLWRHYRDCNAYPHHQLWLTSSVSKCLSLTKTCYKSKRWLPYKWGSAAAASDHVWSSWDWTSCLGLKGKQEGTVTDLEKDESDFLSPSCCSVICQCDVFSLCSDTNRLPPPVIVCCGSLACVCASGDREDTILAVQTHPIKANCLWHRAGLPLMNHVPEVNLIWTGAVQQVTVFLWKKKQTVDDRKWGRDYHEWIYDIMNSVREHEWYMNWSGCERCRIKSAGSQNVLPLRLRMFTQPSPGISDWNFTLKEQSVTYILFKGISVR